jgi:hypothetical protein
MINTIYRLKSRQKSYFDIRGSFQSEDNQLTQLVYGYGNKSRSTPD